MIDKSTWPDGPWMSEPDRLEFEAHGFPCLIVRQPHNGGLCGYVAVPPGHPWYGVRYQDLDPEVHGGLTYSDFCQGNICHVPKPGEPDNVYWLGFDCGHYHDYQPAYPGDLNLRFGHERVYRDIAYVKQQCEELAKQASCLT